MVVREIPRVLVGEVGHGQFGIGWVEEELI